MKNTMTHTLALLIVFSASVVSAADSAYMATTCQIVAENDKLYRLIYQAAKEEDVTIQLFDDQQKLVYKEEVKTAALNKKFDLTNLPYGDYQLEVKSDGYFFSEELKLGDLSSFNFKFDVRGERKVAMVGSKLEGKPLTLYILDENRDVLYKEQFDQDKQVHKNFNFQGMRGNNVTFMLYHQDQVVKEKQFVF